MNVLGQAPSGSPVQPLLVVCCKCNRVVEESKLHKHYEHRRFAVHCWQDWLLLLAKWPEGLPKPAVLINPFRYDEVLLSA